MSGDNQDSVPITISGFSVSIRQWNSGTLLTTDWKFKFMILNLFCFSNLFFFLTGVEVFGERELPSSTLKLFEEQYDVERSSNMVVLKFGRPHFRQFQE